MASRAIGDPQGATSGDQPGLRRAIGRNLLLLFVLGDVLGAGIYTLIGQIAGRVGGAVWAPLLLALGLALLTAFSYSELVTKYPRAGGAAVFAQRAYKLPVVSFLVGFCMLAAGVTSAGSLALAFAGDYLGEFVELPTVAVALAFLALIALLNARGIKDSLRANIAMTMIELTGLLLVVAIGAAILATGDGDAGRALEFRAGSSTGGAILAGAVLAFYAFVGFETSANVAEETENPTRAYPRALLGGLVIAGVLYCLVGIAVSVAVPPAQLANSTGPLLEVVKASPVAIPSRVFSLVALIAVANGALLTMIMASRLTYGMAGEHLLPGVFAKVLPRRRTPVVAIAGTTLLAMALVLTGDLTTLAETTVLLLLFVFVSTNVAVLVLRRDPVDHPHFRAPIAFPVLGALACVGLMTQQTAGTWARAGILIGGAAVLWFATRAVGRRTGMGGEPARPATGT